MVIQRIEKNGNERAGVANISEEMLANRAMHELRTKTLLTTVQVSKCSRFVFMKRISLLLFSDTHFLKKCIWVEHVLLSEIK